MSVSINCSWIDGFVMDPTRKQPVGYLLAFEGLNMGEFLKPDLSLFSPFNTGSAPSYAEAKLDTEKQLISCVGIISNITLPTGVGDPIEIDAYISAANANQIRGKLEKSLTTTTVTKLAWWVCGFDENNKGWYEISHPLDPATVSGQLNARGGGEYHINVQDAVKIGGGIDIAVHPFSFQVIPAADATFNFHRATSMNEKSVIRWGLKIGSAA